MANPTEAIRNMVSGIRQRQVGDGIAILSTETTPDPMAQTWGESRRFIEGHHENWEVAVTEMNVWEFAGTVGETEGRAILVDHKDGSRTWQDENAAYHTDVWECFGEWQRQDPRRERFWYGKYGSQERHGEVGKANAQLRLHPEEEDVTLGELVEATGSFRNFVNSKLKERWGETEL